MENYYYFFVKFRNHSFIHYLEIYLLLFIKFILLASHPFLFEYIKDKMCFKTILELFKL